MNRTWKFTAVQKFKTMWIRRDTSREEREVRDLLREACEKKTA